jgi:autotransporter-associated beta strand protein
LRFEPLEKRRLLSVNVTTARYDLARDGANTSETILTPSDVSSGSFGKIASMTVDAQVYAQPLLVNGVTVSGQTHNVLYVATENDTVYAFDAQGNNPAQGYLWKTSLINLGVSNSGETAGQESDYGTTDIIPLVGITGTPVIDPNTKTLYVVGLFKEPGTPASSHYQQRLYALDITNGTAKLGGPVTLSASVTGSGAGSSNNVLPFDPFRENQRPALTLANGEVYIGFASHGDQSPWHGWVLAYNAATLHQDYVYCNTPNGSSGGIWMSGGGIAVDSSGNLYFTTGNGTFDVNTGGSDYGMTIQKLSPSLAPEDYFAPYNESSLSGADLDYGCSNVILLTNQSGSAPNEILSEGKWGQIYLNNANTGQMGEFTSTAPNHDLGEAAITTNISTSNVHNTDAYWNGYVYSGGDALPIEAFAVGNSTLGTTPTSQSSHIFGSPSIEDGQGAGVSVSSNGTSNGILWALDNSGFNSNPAVLYAYDATNLNTVLWTSTQAAGGRDTGPNAVKFQTPVVANGYVYVAGAGSVTIYGLLPSAPTVTLPASANPSPVTGTTTNLSVSATDQVGDLPPTYTWAASSAPTGAMLPTFSVNGTTSANNTTATFYAAGNYTFTCTITDPTSNVSITSSVNVTVNQTLISGLSALSPTTVTVVDGGSLQFVGGGTDQFGNPMTAPATWTVNSGGAGGTVDNNGFYTAPSSGTGTDTVKVSNGTQSATTTVTVVAPLAPVTQVNLSGYFNRNGIVPDGQSYTTGGLDGGGNALSGNLLGTSAVFNGSSFTIATASTTGNNVVYGAGQTITLPQGQFGYLEMLADHTNGPGTNETLAVTYTDNSTATFTQTFGDWVTGSGGITGQSIAVTMAYRDTGGGGEDTQTTYVYGYKFGLTSGKTVQSLTLPSDSKLDVLAIDLVPAVPAPGIAITTPAAANPSVAGTSTSLSVSAVDTAGDAAPIYSWATTLMPAGATAPTFSVNNSASANATTATITQAGTYGFTATVTDPTSGATVLSSAKVVANFGLFTSSVDIGSPLPAGSLSYNSTSGAYTTIAGGADIGGSSDQFHYTYESISGNSEITARVTSLSNSNASAKAGPMFRDSSAANGAFAAMFVTPSSGVVFEWRSADGGAATSTTVNSIAAPVWLRLNQANGQFSGYYSTNGTSWTQVGTSQSISMGASDLAGLAATSHASGTSATAVIDNVAVVTPPTVATPASANPSPVTSTTTNLGVLGADAGGEATLTYTWATTGTPPALVGFSPNGTNAAKSSTVTFIKVGSYNFMVTITNPTTGLSVTSAVGVTVQPTLTTIVVLPYPATLAPNGTQQLSAKAYNQFNVLMSPQPSFSWSTTVGSITGAGTLTAPSSDASGTAYATVGSVNGSTIVTVTDPAPTVATPAAAMPSIVTAETTSLYVLGADDEGESALIYSWATTGTPPAAVSFSLNGTNAAKDSTATFTMAGDYSFLVTISNPTTGLSVTSNVDVTVNQSYSSMIISPTAPNLTGGATQPLSATALDQFNQPLASQPPITWTLLSGPGTLTGAGLYTPPYAGGSAVVQAASGAYNASANVTFSSEALWNAASSSSWSTGGNWIDAFTSGTLAAPGVRGLTGDTVLFASSPVARLDGVNPTLAAVTFNNAATGYGITQGSAGSLTLQGGIAGGSATVSVLAGNPAINAPLHLASSTTFSAAASTTLTMNGPIDGSGSLTTNGSGRLVLNGVNTFSGGLAVRSGTVVINAADGLVDGCDVTVGSAGAFSSPVVASAAPARVSAPITLASKSLSPRALAAVMSAGQPIPPDRISIRPTAAIFPNIPASNLSQSVKDLWWLRDLSQI